MASAKPAEAAKPGFEPLNFPVFITVGSHLRDFETYSAAIDIVLREHPSARFVGIGTRQKGGGNSRLDDDRVQSLSGISDDDLLRSYWASSIAVFPFHHATANNALLEAMACGLPVVASDVGGVREIVGDCALLAAPWDPEALAASMLQAVDDVSLASRLGAHARIRARSLDYAVVASRMRDVYREVWRRGTARYVDSSVERLEVVEQPR